jgi:phosphate acyltransferase
MRIALDAMGGDHAPGPIVAGAVQAVEADPELHVVLVGDQARLEPLLPATNRDRLDVFHCTQVVGMEEKPVNALRMKPDNSIKRCWELLAGGKVGGIVSAGNTGAMVGGGHIARRFLRGVLRPAIAAMMPTSKKPCVLLDVGANIHAKPEHLFQYGIMGSLFARHILGTENPKIGLLNIGEEEGKGHDLAQTTNTLFRTSPFRDRFLGNVEGRDIHKGEVNVVVCDGFVGNVVLKYGEGLSSFIMREVYQHLTPALQTERAQAERAVKELALKYDYSTFGGAPLLGVDGACIICHGSSGDRAIKNALAVAMKYARNHVSDLIVQELEALPPPATTSGAG